jgi:hypothetical protein
MRQWGNQPWPASLLTQFPTCADPAGSTTHTHCNAKRRLWLAAVDTTIGTTDPSHPAIYLEGQEPTDATQWTPNMRGFYTLAPCIPTATPGADGGMMTMADAGSTRGPPPGTPCTAGFECCSGFCQNSMCVEPNSLSCVGLGGMCMSSGDCCNSPAVACINGFCAIPIRR